MSDTARLNLSGFLPGAAHNGLSVRADDYVETFEKAYSTGDGNPELIMVVGMLKPVSVRHRSDPENNPPTVELRFVHIEPVQTAAGQKQLRKLLDDLVVKRTGVTPLPMEDL